MYKELKLYLDTSVLNIALEVIREESNLTKEFLEQASKENHNLYISDLVENEIGDAYELRKRELIRLIRELKPSLLYSTEEAISLAEIYLRENLIPLKSRDDAIHIAIATIHRIDFLVSWNFKHIVRARTIKGVHLINLREGYKLIEIVSPREFLGK